MKIINMVEKINTDLYEINNLSYHNYEFLESDDARPIRILSEYIEPKTRLERTGVTDAIVIFGSARILSEENAKKQLEKIKKNPKSTNKEIKEAKKKLSLSKYYEDAREISYKLTQWTTTINHHRRFVITTGGGPGIMEAANRGAHEAGGVTLGFNIKLPHEQFINPYVLKNHAYEFHYFFMRKFWFSKLAKVMIIFPGGLGTLDEFFSLLTLTQTGIVKKEILFIIYDENHWKKLINFKQLVDDNLISTNDMNLIKFCSTIDETYITAKNYIEQKYLNIPQ